jgi:type VI secretion system protein ImpF
MPSGDAKPVLVVSVLDRLIDEQPRVSSEPPPTPERSLAAIKRGLVRDLNWLLNTRRALPPARAGDGLARSPLAYGLPDLTTLSLDNPHDRDRLVRFVREAIARFEPRLRDLEVAVADGRRDERGLRFQISGVLLVEPEAEAVQFDSFLELPTRAFAVRDDAGAGAPGT